MRIFSLAELLPSSPGENGETKMHAMQIIPAIDLLDGQCVRLNFGCTRARLTEALSRMEKAILQRSI